MTAILPDIELVIFDCDGVLVDSEHLAAEAMMGVLAQGGVDVPHATIMKGVGMKLADILGVIETDLETTIDAGLVTDLWPETQRLFGERLQPTPGIAAFLETLPTKRCVASSSHPERIAFSLETTGLSRFFGEGAVFSSTMVRNGKPAPDLFLLAASRMGVDPARCLVIEDSRFGVAGAVAAGATAFGYTGGCHATEASAPALKAAGAVHVGASWQDLRENLSAYRLVPKGATAFPVNKSSPGML